MSALIDGLGVGGQSMVEKLPLEEAAKGYEHMLSGKA
jgi:hypothetical protein